MCMQKREQVILKYTDEKAVIERLRETPELYQQYERLDRNWKQRFMDYCMGKKTLPLTYDPFFKRTFHPDIHPERLSRFLSSILGERVRVIRILPQEETLLDGSALLIMDILVLRQYSRVKGEKGKAFKYNDIKPVYTIVIYEKSLPVFHEVPGAYIHKGKTVFDTGLKVELLQKYWLVALDVFREIAYSIDSSEQKAWLSLLASEDVEEAEKLSEEYPWLGEIYQEMEGYLHKPQEVLNMFSEALRILDRNTVQYMVEQQQEQINQMQEQISHQSEQLEEKDEQISHQSEQLEEKDEQISHQNEQIKKMLAEIAYLKKSLCESNTVV